MAFIKTSVINKVVVLPNSVVGVREDITVVDVDDTKDEDDPDYVLGTRTKQSRLTPQTHTIAQVTSYMSSRTDNVGVVAIVTALPNWS
jgi:hypothetical protein